MKRIVLDTNVLVRFFANDHAAHFLQAKKLFAEAESGRCSLVVLPIVVAETIFVLQSFYKISSSMISSSLQVLLSQRWLHVEERTIILETVRLMAKSNMHFVDAYLLAYAKEQGDEVFTFDRKLKSLLAPEERVRS